MATQYIVNFTDPEVTPFNINSFTTDGPVAPTTLELSSTAVRASTSLLLYGKGHPDYGERIQENLINLMENFSGATEPKFPISGQTWFARITYAFTGLYSPQTSNVYRWVDNSALANGGSWRKLNNVGASDPTTSDQVKTSGIQPTTVVDGAFWLDTAGSPLVPELYIGVNNTSSNLSATWVKREMEDLTGLVGPGGQFAANVPGSPELGSYFPQKQLKVYDGVEWKNSGNVYVNHVPPQSPTIGDLWYQIGVVGSPPAGSPTLGGGGGPLSQLFIWARPGPNKTPRWLTTGYVDRSGDTMTGTLSFGLPTSSLFLWEGQGDDTAGPDLRATGNALLTSADNFYIHIDDDASDANAGGNVFEIASNTQSRGTHNSLFQVRNDGIIRSALPWGSPGGGLGSPNTYKTLLLSADDNALVNKAYVDGAFASLSALTARVTLNEGSIEKLAGSPLGSPILGKVNRTGDTMTGTLTFSQVGSPNTGAIAIDTGFFLISNVQAPVGPDDAATKGYVDDQLALLGSPIGTDVYVSSALWVPSTQLLTLERTGGLVDLNVVLSQQFNTTGVVHTATTPFLRDTFQEDKLGSPLFGSPVTTSLVQPSQAEVNNTALENLNTRVTFVELPYAREILTTGVGSPLAAGGSPVINNTQFAFTHDTYVAGTNRLYVFVNGVKQYADERAHQHIQFNDLSNLSSTTRTLLNEDSTSYTLAIAVDGGSPAQVLTVVGAQAQIFQDIVDEINAQITGATATWNFPNGAIDVYSDATGTGSSIDIIDGVGGSPLNGPSSILGTLSITVRSGEGSPAPGVGSPTGTFKAYTLGNISPVADGPISLVSQNLAYFEADSVFTDAFFGEQTSTIVFNSQQQPGDVIELIYAPVSS